MDTPAAPSVRLALCIASVLGGSGCSAPLGPVPEAGDPGSRATFAEQQVSLVPPRGWTKLGGSDVPGCFAAFRDAVGPGGYYKRLYLTSVPGTPEVDFARMAHELGVEAAKEDLEWKELEHHEVVSSSGPAIAVTGAARTYQLDWRTLSYAFCTGTGRVHLRFVCRAEDFAAARPAFEACAATFVAERPARPELARGLDGTLRLENEGLVLPLGREWFSVEQPGKRWFALGAPPASRAWFQVEVLPHAGSDDADALVALFLEPKWREGGSTVEVTQRGDRSVAGRRSAWLATRYAQDGRALASRVLVVPGRERAFFLTMWTDRDRFAEADARFAEVVDRLEILTPKAR